MNSLEILESYRKRIIMISLSLQHINNLSEVEEIRRNVESAYIYISDGKSREMKNFSSKYKNMTEQEQFYEILRYKLTFNIIEEILRNLLNYKDIPKSEYHYYIEKIYNTINDVL